MKKHNPFLLRAKTLDEYELLVQLPNGETEYLYCTQFLVCTHWFTKEPGVHLMRGTENCYVTTPSLRPFQAKILRYTELQPTPNQ